MNPIFQPNMPTSIITPTSFINGAAIKNEKVTPSGMPLSTKPMKRGMAEHEQKGVMIPNVLANTFPTNKGLPSNAFLVFSGEKNDRTIPIKKMINSNNNVIFNKVLRKNQSEFAI